MSAKIFISYRRADSQYVTDSIYEHMARHFGADNVFLDVGSIPFGVDFRKYLHERIDQADIVLVIIGPDWARLMAERGAEISDFVRIEVEYSLLREKLVVPVLVMGATMPDFSQLPEAIRSLQWRNAATVRRQPDLGPDCERLAQGLRQAMGLPDGPAEPQQATPVAESGLVEVHSRVNDLLPGPFAWARIPAGVAYTVDGEVQVPTFAIGRYPVTNAQYAAFIAAGGYTTRDWWTEAGWRICQDNGWQAPRYWGERFTAGDTRPVGGLSWYEADAYARWLAFTAGEAISLPREAQWQRAAQGDDGRFYPWGDEWDCKRCNNSVLPCGSDAATPVDRYAGIGESPFGVVDMVGNLWDWCADDYETGALDPEAAADWRSVRGASFKFAEAVDYQVSRRGRESPDYRIPVYGMRLALAE
jgi:hypothetical protein